MRSIERYMTEQYLERNPTWHTEDAPWKAAHILTILSAHAVKPTSICDVGCGTGEVLRRVHEALSPSVRSTGFDVSPAAHSMASTRATPGLTFELGDVMEYTKQRPFDLALIIDVVEHIEDYIGFVRNLQHLAGWKLFHFPLDLSALSVLRMHPILSDRRDVGHLHYFTKEIIESMLGDLGYEIIGLQYARSPWPSWRARLASIPRRLAFAGRQDLAVRALGGYSLFVLTR